MRSIRENVTFYGQRLGLLVASGILLSVMALALLEAVGIKVV